MVERKGIGYAIESLIAVATVLIFIFGSLQIPDNQDWDSFRRQASADDLTYAIQDSEYMNHALSEGEIGSVQTAFSTITERNVEISGLVSNLPINENRVAFYTKPSRRHLLGIEEVNGGCEGDLEEITQDSEEPPLRVNGSELGTPYDDETLYFGDLDPNQVGNNGKTDYDTVWVDNRTDCQFAEDEARYFIDDFIKLGPHNFDIERINASLDEVELYNATQTVRFRDMLNRPVNDIKAFTTVDSADFNEVDSTDYNVLVLRTDEAVEEVNGPARDVVEDHLQQGSVLVMADLNSDNFNGGDFMKEAGFKYIGVPYSASYSGGEVSGNFTSEEASQDIQSYFRGFRGQRNAISLKSPRVISNSDDKIQSTESIINSEEKYELSQWNRGTTSMSDDNPGAYPGKPDSECYGTTSSSLTSDSLQFPDGEDPGSAEDTHEVLNVELGASPSYCATNNTRAVMVDVDRDGDFQDADEGPILNNGRIDIADRPYAVRIRFASINPLCGEGQCLDFIYVGDRDVELIPFRQNLGDVGGDRIALSSYESRFEEEDRKIISSTVHWLRGDQLAFTGRNEPVSISTSTYSSIRNETYIPYEVNLRWSK
jgi:hypothetical protein